MQSLSVFFTLFAVVSAINLRRQPTPQVAAPTLPVAGTPAAPNFTHYDTNGDGQLSPQEVQAMGCSPKGCPKTDCTPKCKWACQKQECDQVCTPKCKAPRCQTRCIGKNAVAVKMCKMDCSKPQCAVICPDKSCGSNGCPACKTECGAAPVCKLNCQDTLSCKEVCENPICEWQCQQPTICPAPNCNMHCDMPNAHCTAAAFGDMPPLNAGELVVESFGADVVQAPPAPAAVNPLAAPAPAAAGAGFFYNSKSTMQKRMVPVKVELGVMVDGKVSVVNTTMDLDVE